MAIRNVSHNLVNVGRVVRRDVFNSLRYGKSAPLTLQRIWINPQHIGSYTTEFSNHHSGLVRSGDWDLATMPISSDLKWQACRQRWLEGSTWEETGLIHVLLKRIERSGSHDGCRSHAELVLRYKRIDEMFERIASEAKLGTVREARKSPFWMREHGGILVHIGRDCLPIFGGKGNHRLAAATILGLDEIPAQVGVVHKSSLAEWKQRFVR